MNRRFPIFSLLSVTLIHGAIPSALAQQANPADEDVILVLGRSLPEPEGSLAYGVVTLDRETLNRTANGTIEGALSAVPGLAQFRRSDSRSANPSAQGLTLRGIGGNASSRTLLVLDGVPQADPFFGSVPFNGFATSRLSAVRVIRGAGTGAFGSGAVAGTIDLVSADESQLSSIWGGAVFGSRDSVSAEAGGKLNLGLGFTAVSGRFDRSDGFLTTPENQRVSATVPARYRNWSVEARAAAPVGAVGELQARLMLLRDNRTLRFAGADSFSDGQDASIRYIHRGAWDVEMLAYVQARDFGNVVISATRFTPTLRQLATPSTGLGAKFELRPPEIGPFSLRIGADVRRLSGETREEALNAVSGAVTTRRRAGGTSSNAGLFAEADVDIGIGMLTGGMRLDGWRLSRGRLKEEGGAGESLNDTMFPTREGAEFTGRIGAQIPFDDNLTLRGAAYTGFRLPTLNELYRPFAVFPVTTRANAALTPERSRGAEIGAEWMPIDGVTVSATGFVNRLADAVANVTIGTNLRQRQNVRAIRSQGVETALLAERGAWSIRLAYDLASARVDASGALDGKRPAQTPTHSASASIAWWPKLGPGLSANLRHVGRQFEDDLETDALPAATIVDIGGQWRFAGDWAITARIENVGNERVVTRNVAGSIDLGVPRVVWLGVRLGN